MFRYSCFISYRRYKDDERSDKFIRLLHKELSSHIVPLVSQEIFLDYSQMTGGDNIHQTLSAELCKSCCMVMVFAPAYFDREHLYCTREYLSMVKLEGMRQNYIASGKSLIIPIIYKGTTFYEKCVLKDRAYHDFTGYGLWGPETLKTKDLQRKVRAIADYVAERFQEFGNEHSICVDCDKHILVSEGEAIKWLDENWHRPEKDSNAIFPLRSH